MRETITIADVGREAGVSTATVSHVLSGREGARISPATRDRVLRAAEHLGYRRNSIASALRMGRTRTVGIVSAHMSFDRKPAHSTYVTDLMVAMCVAASRARLSAVVMVDKPQETLSVEAVTDRRVDGLILFGMYRWQDWLQSVLQTGTPCVEINSSCGEYQVHTDNRGGIVQAVEHLRALGHRHIAHLHGAPSILAARQRATGFQEAMQAAGLEREAVIFPDLDALQTHMRAPNRPTAIVCFNDELACQALDALNALGLRVPHDVSLVGFDNSLYSDVMRPRLTTIQNPLDDIATAAVALLQSQFAGLEPAQKVQIMPTRLILRDTTARRDEG